MKGDQFLDGKSKLHISFSSITNIIPYIDIPLPHIPDEQSLLLLEACESMSAESFALSAIDFINQYAFEMKRIYTHPELLAWRKDNPGSDPPDAFEIRCKYARMNSDEGCQFRDVDKCVHLGHYQQEHQTLGLE